jgi:hypothetical protein
MEASEQKTFRIKLSLKGNIPKIKGMKNIKPQQVLTIAPLMTLSDLIDTAIDRFQIPVKKYGVELYYGFPPRKINIESMGSECLLSKFVQEGESVTCQIVSTSNKSQVEKKTETISSTNGTISSAKDSDSGPSVLRSQRNASIVATESFKTVIAEQDRLLKEENASKNSTTKKIKQPPSAAQLAARKKMAEARAAAANTRKLSNLPGGRTLNEEESRSRSTNDSNDSTPHQRRNPKASSLFSNLSSEDDISFALISSMEGGSGTKVSKVLRSAMRKSIQKSYEVSRAVVRNSAIASKAGVMFLPCQSTARVNNSTGTFVVKYLKGIEGTGYYEEKCHIISKEMLKAVIESVYKDDSKDEEDDIPSGREMLKPSNMALLSPRVFWSLWYHYKDCSSNIEEALEKILPDLNWNFLYRRSRQLSERARENLLQQKGKNGVASNADHNAGVKAVKAVEEAMENLYDNTLFDARERAAQAALARVSQNVKPLEDTILWKLETPMETDEDELRDCINSCDHGMTDIETEACVKAFLNAGIHNWRILANSSKMQVLEIIESCKIDESTVTKWISDAQNRSIDEIMLEILEGNLKLFEVLRDEASSGTPQDLSLWQEAPSVLFEIVPSLCSSEFNITEDEMAIYCAKAKKAMNSLTWLSEYSTSIVE